MWVARLVLRLILLPVLVATYWLVLTLAVWHSLRGP